MRTIFTPDIFARASPLESQQCRVRMKGKSEINLVTPAPACHPLQVGHQGPGLPQAAPQHRAVRPGVAAQHRGGGGAPTPQVWEEEVLRQFLSPGLADLPVLGTETGRLQAKEQEEGREICLV